MGLANALVSQASRSGASVRRPCSCSTAFTSCIALNVPVLPRPSGCVPSLLTDGTLIREFVVAPRHSLHQLGRPASCLCFSISPCAAPARMNMVSPFGSHSSALNSSMPRHWDSIYGQWGGWPWAPLVPRLVQANRAALHVLCAGRYLLCTTGNRRNDF